MSTLIEGLSTAVIGMLVVFLGLILLIAVISLMRLFSEGQKPAAQQKAAVPAPVSQPEAAEETMEDDGAIVAAITAAISMLMQKEGEDSSFVVRRIVRRGLRARS